MGQDTQSSPAQTLVVEAAEILLPSKNISQDVEFWTGDPLNFRMDQIVGISNHEGCVGTSHAEVVWLIFHVVSCRRSTSCYTQWPWAPITTGQSSFFTASNCAAALSQRTRSPCACITFGSSCRIYPRRGTVPASGYTTCVHMPSSEGQCSLGHRSCGHAVSRSHPVAFRWRYHCIAHSNSERWTGSRPSSLPYNRIPAHLLLQRLGTLGLRRPGSTFHSPSRRLCHSASEDSASRSGVFRELAGR